MLVVPKRVKRGGEYLETSEAQDVPNASEMV
jgi:hypothetical protein